MKSGFALSIIGLLGVAIVVAFGAEDSAIRDAGETEYHYTFQIDSSYTPWSWTLPTTISNISVADASDDGRVVALASSESPGAQYKDYYIFVEGELTHTFENVHKVFISRGGDKILVKPRTPWDDVDWAGGRVFCFTSLGDTLWGPQYSRFDPVWSPGDSMIGLFTGEGDLNEMPADEGDFLNEIELDVTRVLRIAGAENGNLLAEEPIHKYGIWYLGAFRQDMGGFIGYKIICELSDIGPVSETDTLSIFDTREGRFSLVNKVSPITPPNDTVYSATCLTGTYAMFDHRIYLSWGWKPKIPDPNGYFTQYFCLDSLGNLIWHKYDTTKAHARYYSESGRYLIETKVGNNGLIILRRTEDNEILFQMDYPDAGGLLLADIHEHSETGNAFVVAVDKSGNSVILYPDGTLADFDMLGLRLCNNPDFAMQKDGANITFYKVRW